MINILLSRAVLNVDNGMANDMNDFIYPLNGFYHFSYLDGSLQLRVYQCKRGQSSVNIRDIIDTCIKRRFGHSIRHSIML